MDYGELESQLQRARKDQLVSACNYYSILRSGNKPDLIFRLKHHAVTKGVTMTELLAVLSGMTGDSRAPPDKSGNVSGRIKVSHPETSPVATPVAPWIHDPYAPRSMSPARQVIPRTYQTHPSGPAITNSFMPVPTPAPRPVVPAQTRPVQNARRSNLENPVACHTELLYFDVFHPPANLPNSANPGLKFIAINTVFIDDIRLEISDMLDWRRRGFGVWIRGIKTGSPAVHAWQKCMQIRINEFLALDVAPPKPMKKRRDDPVEITQFLRNGSNQIRLDVRDIFYEGEFEIGFIVCKVLTPAEIAKTVLRETTQTCSNRIKSILQRPSEIEVADTTRRVDLRCPVSQFRLKIPVRTRACEHISWFDLDAFIETNKRTPNINLRWKCPKCQKSATPAELVIDGFAEFILQATTVDEIEFSTDGKWNACAPVKQKLEPKEFYESEELPVPRRVNDDVVDLIDDAPPRKKQKSTVISLE